MKRVLLSFMLVYAVGLCAQRPPSILLSSAALKHLRHKAQMKDPTWAALKATCDRYIGGGVYFPDDQAHSEASPPDIGRGYQGEYYRDHVIEQGLCYQTMIGINAAGATAYGSKLVDILMKMSDPAHQTDSGAGSASIYTRDDGYGIRNYGIMGLGYDWGRDLMTAAQRQQVYNALNVWVDIWTKGWVSAIVSGGQVTKVNVNANPNYYFASTPSVSFSGGCGGSGAAATATLTGGYVSGISVTNPGSGYGCDPSVSVGDWAGILWESTHPLSNYFAGYYMTHALAALATAGDNPRASEIWNSWYSTTHQSRVQPWLGTYLVGGGTPEGFMSYGELATMNFGWPTIAVNDVKGIDLVHAAAPFTQPVDTLDYMLYFTWPSLKAVYDEDVGHSGSAAPNGVQGGFYQFLGYLGKYWNASHTAHFHKFTKDVLAASGSTGNEWQQFLYWDSNDPDADYSTLPLSYKASGMQRVAARSDWTTSAVWWAFNASPQINSPGQGEQFFGTGQFEIIHGVTPFIVVPGGWLLREGSAGENNIYTDNYASPRKRSFYNTFQVYSGSLEAGQWTGSSAIPPLPPGEIDNIGGTSRTGLTAYEDGTNYVVAIAQRLEDMYRTWGAPDCGPITSLSRELVYLRPTNQLVVYDRSTICNAAYTQYLALHTPSNPAPEAQSPPVTGTTRLDVTYNSKFAGSIISVLPASVSVATADLDGGATVWRTTIKPTVAQTRNLWVTVFDMNNSPAAVWNASLLGTTTNNMAGVLLKGPSSNNVVLCNRGEQGTTVAGNITYIIPNGVSTHVLTELPASSMYDITAATGANQTITVTPNASGGYSTTAAGTLTFGVSATGSVTR